MKVLYLDFDGVLHDDAVYVSAKKGIHIDTPGRTLFEWMPMLEQALEPYPEIQIVLSTSWVRGNSFSFAKNKLSQTLEDRVIGATFHNALMQKWDFDNMSRGMQIWADVVRRKPTAWCALDNDAFGWPTWCRDRLVKTEDRTGIGCPDAQDRLRQMLSSMSSTIRLEDIVLTPPRTLEENQTGYDAEHIAEMTPAQAVCKPDDESDRTPVSTLKPGPAHE
jgi:hypothetical protein